VTNLERPSDPELRRQMARAEAEAARARFWLSCTRLVLGGFVAVSSGALAGAALWYFAGSEPTLPDLGPTLVTAGGGDRTPATLAPDPDLAPPDLVPPDWAAPETVIAESSAPELVAEAPAVPEAKHPDPQAVPILVPDESLQLSWMEEPPIQQGDKIAVLIERQGSAADDAKESAADAADTQTATAQLLRKPSVGQIDTALANLDLESLSPADVIPQNPPAWRRHAVPVAKPFEGPVIALVMDDLGLNRPNTRRTIELPGPLTLAMMTYAETLQEFADKARSNGHELLVHFPMAPRDLRYDPGPNALRAELGKEELARRLAWGLSRFEGFVGLNNHMGSGFTASIPGMAQVMVELKARGLLYLDSLTVPGAVGAPLADRLGVPFAIRDVFIDNDFQDRAAIRRQLQQLERVALRRGAAIGIGHPHDATLEVLAAWLPEVQKRGFTLVPISALVRTPKGLAVTPSVSNSPG
jgi:polysaccharide deacetylase 2 family uncharacterized protein YibQ